MGFKAYITTATVGSTPNSDLIWEYWDGTNWIGFKVMTNIYNIDCRCEWNEEREVVSMCGAHMEFLRKYNELSKPTDKKPIDKGRYRMCGVRGCDNEATHTWSGHPTCDDCATPGRKGEVEQHTNRKITQSDIRRVNDNLERQAELISMPDARRAVLSVARAFRAELL